MRGWRPRVSSFRCWPIDVLFQIGGVLPVNLLFAGDVLTEVVLGEYQRVAFDRSRDDVHFVLRIECPQSFDRNVECRGHFVPGGAGG